jgi:hypothetical protein
MRQLVAIISLLAGFGDFAAGLLLVIAPQTALQWMHVSAVNDPVWIRFIGVFVGCVGLSYLFGLLTWHTVRSARELRTVWKLTAMFRLAAGSFVAVAIGLGSLDRAWTSVPIADFFWAVVQLAILSRGYPEDE